MEKLAKFAALGLSAEMLRSLKTKGFEEPTEIQEKIIPIMLNTSQDLIGQAQTGTGKTAAFGIPIIENLKPKSKNVQALILVPTRELAIQVSEELNSFKMGKKLRIIPVYGGQSISLQLSQLKKGVDIVVGTPGRILDHLHRRSLNLQYISYAVLDEADEMLNMGFIEDVQDILEHTNEDRTTLLFSATMPKEIMNVAKNYMHDVEKIAIKRKQLTVDLTDQIYFEVPGSHKFEALCRIIDFESDFYGLVFCRTKVDVDHIANHLNDRGYEAEGLHGDISQAQREKILNRFKKKRLNILIATDVAARGIDIQDLTHVINYAIPQDPEAYVHRIGRTGRAGKAGTAITFITPDEYRKLMFIQRIAKTDIRKEKLPKVHDIISIKKEKITRDVSELVESNIPETYRKMAIEMLEDTPPADVVSALLKYAFQDELNPESYNEIRDVHPKIQGKTRLFVAKGKRDKMTKKKLVEFIKSKAGVEDRKIDDARVLDSYSFITVPLKEAEMILQVFQASNRGKRPLVEVAKPGRK